MLKSVSDDMLSVLVLYGASACSSTVIFCVSLCGNAQTYQTLLILSTCMSAFSSDIILHICIYM